MKEDIIKTEGEVGRVDREGLHMDTEAHRPDIRLLNKKNTIFKETPGGFVSATVDGKELGRVSIIRTFPLTDEDRYLSVRLPDGKQEEIGLIEDINDFEMETREIIEKQLRLRYYMPKITSIVDIKEQYGYTYWTVETDKGRAKFASSSGSAGAVIRHKEGVIINDSNGNRYYIEDLSRLTSKEMKKLDLYL